MVSYGVLLLMKYLLIGSQHSFPDHFCSGLLLALLGSIPRLKPRAPVEEHLVSVSKTCN